MRDQTREHIEIRIKQSGGSFNPKCNVSFWRTFEYFPVLLQQKIENLLPHLGLDGSISSDKEDSS